MAEKAKLFAPDEELLQIWANFTEKSDEKCFTKFVKVSTSYPEKVPEYYFWSKVD